MSAVIARMRATAGKGRSWWLGPVGMLLGAASVALTPRPIDTATSDPSFYLGYVLDYGDLAARYGQTYHGNRLAYLLPEMGAFWLLGPERGYLALRWLLLAVTAVVVMLVALPRLGRAGAVLFGVAVVAVPPLAPQLFWTHFDGFAAVYLLVAAVLLLEHRDRPVRHLAAGALLGLVVNANLAYLLFVGALGLAWLVASAGPMARRLVATGRVLVGLVGVELLLSAVLARLGPEGPWFIEVVPFRFALRHAGDDTWFEPLRTVLAASPMLLAIVVVAGLAALAARADRSSATVGADVARLSAWWLTVALGLLLVGHLVFRAGWLSLRQYVVLLGPGTILALVGIAAVLRQRLAQDGRSPSRLALTIWTASWSLGLLWIWTAGRVGRWVLPVAVVAAGVVLLALLRWSGGVVGSVALALVPALLLPAWGYGSPRPADGGEAAAVAAEREWDVFRAIVAVQGMIGAEIPTDRDLVFWHTVTGEDADLLRRINMVQYGRGAGRLHRDKGDVVGMPDLPPFLVDELLLRRPVTVILLATDRRELLEGLVVLTTAAPGAVQSRQEVIGGEVMDVHVALVEIG